MGLYYVDTLDMWSTYWKPGNQWFQSGYVSVCQQEPAQGREKGATQFAAKVMV